MDDSNNGPLIVLLSCGHTGALTDRDTFSPHRVVPYAGGWAVEGVCTWCAACVAAGRAPVGIGWDDAWAEVKRRRAADLRA